VSLSRNQIKDNLYKLGIRFEDDFNESGWMKIICPFHADKNFGSAFINESTVIKCFSCGTTSNLFKAVKKNFPSLSSSQIFTFLGDERLTGLTRVLADRIEREKQTDKARKIFRVDWDKLSKAQVDLNLYYCRTREFTQEWIDKFKVTLITEGFYEGYFCIPIVFQNKVITYEFRKALEFEKLKELYPNVRGKLEDLRTKFKNDENVDQNWYSLTYLKKGKTLYPKGNIELKAVIFNYDDLDLDADTYVSEGIAGTADVFKNISKNCTATFGVNVSDKQIELLKTIRGRKIIINDGDLASDAYIWTLSSRVPDVYVYPEMIPGSRYLLEKSGFFDIKIN